MKITVTTATEPSINSPSDLVTPTASAGAKKDPANAPSSASSNSSSASFNTPTSVDEGTASEGGSPKLATFSQELLDTLNNGMEQAPQYVNTSRPHSLFDSTRPLRVIVRVAVLLVLQLSLSLCTIHRKREGRRCEHHAATHTTYSHSSISLVRTPSVS